MRSFVLSALIWIGLAPVALPVVTRAQFQVGASWTWEYLENGALYSTERYTVIKTDADTVWIELSSKFPGGADFRATHRLRVRPGACLAAHAAGGEPKPWSFDMFARTGEDWQQIETTNTLAFEEKFNCDPHVYAPGSRDYVTVFKDALFSQRRWGRIESSWYFADGPDAGLAAEKTFLKPAGQPLYVFRFVPSPSSGIGQ